MWGGKCMPDADTLASGPCPPSPRGGRERQAMLLGVDLDKTRRTISTERQLHGPDNCKSEKIGIKFRRDNCAKIFNPKTQTISPIETNRTILFWLCG